MQLSLPMVLLLASLGALGCTSSFQLGAGAERSSVTDSSATLSGGFGVGRTIRDHTAVVLSGGADVAITDDNGLEAFWSTQVGFDAIYQDPSPALGFQLGPYVAFGGSPDSRRFIGPGARLSLFPFVRRKRGERSSHFSFERYNMFTTLGLQLDAQYLEERGEPDATPQSGYAIRLSFVYATFSIFR